MSKKKRVNQAKNMPLLESSLIKAMQLIDNQIAREMQRSPEERELHGVQKWEPYQKRIEKLTSVVLQELGDQKVSMDSLLVFYQVFSKSLSITVDDLGESGLGKTRSQYCLTACESVAYDNERILKVLKGSAEDQLN